MMRRAGLSTRARRVAQLGLCVVPLLHSLPAASSTAGNFSAPSCAQLNPTALAGACQAVRESQRLQAEHRPQEALDRLPGSVSLPAVVKPAVEALRAELLMQSGGMQAALPLVRALDEGGGLSGYPGLLRSLRLELARAHIAAREFPAATSLLQQLIAQEQSRGLDVEARAMLATTLLAEGSKGRALPHVVKLLLDAPAHPLVVPLEAALDDGSVRLNEQQALKRLDNLLRTARYERLLVETKTVGPPARSRSAANIQRQTLRVT
ncbi:MAG: hypothetical protein ACO3JL_15770, partial [Myxococcota bacterium]